MRPAEVTPRWLLALRWGAAALVGLYLGALPFLAYRYASHGFT